MPTICGMVLFGTGLVGYKSVAMPAEWNETYIVEELITRN